MATEIKKSLLGKLCVAYDCPECGERLRSTTDKIGEKDSCPTCQTVFLVPGQLEFQRHRDKEKAIAEGRASITAIKAAAAEQRVRMAAGKANALKGERSKEKQQPAEELGTAENAMHVRQASAGFARNPM